jgi:hypothetical protein
VRIVYDAEALRDAVVAFAPDLVMHQRPTGTYYEGTPPAPPWRLTVA